MSEHFFAPQQAFSSCLGQKQALSPRCRRFFWPAIIGLLLLGLIVTSPWLLRLSASRQDDMKAVVAYNEGIALMEQYLSYDAIAKFEKAVRLAPDRLEYRINLGLALLAALNDNDKFPAYCKETLEEVLRRDPDNPHAHFCLGILFRNQKSGDSLRHFKAVLAKDRDDAYSCYWLGTLQQPGSDEQTRCFREALKRRRHLGGALYGMAMNHRRKNPEAAELLLEENEALKNLDWEEKASVRFGEMGPYAEPIVHVRDIDAKPRIGPLPRFQLAELNVQLAPGARWATAADFGRFAVGEVRRRVRARFGATLAALDYNGDGKLDLFLPGAVSEMGQVRDLLLRNDGQGRFTDVTAEAGLAEPRPTLGYCVADFDNDGSPDLLLTGIGRQRLFRNTRKGKFEDVTAKAGLDKLTSVCLGAAFLDLDHDGNLDLLICEYAANARLALETLKGARKPGGLVAFLNTGTAPSVDPTSPRPALSCAFRRSRDVPGLKDEILGLVNVAVSDLDGDGDLDLLVLADGSAPAALLNDRLLRFRHARKVASALPAGLWNGALVLEADHDGRSDLFLIGRGQALRLLVERVIRAEDEGNPWFTARTTDSPPLRQAIAADIDLDSWTDMIGLSEEGVPILLHNKGGRLEVSDRLGGDWPHDLIGLTVGDFNGDDNPDLLIWSEAEGLQLRADRRTSNNALHLELACTKQRVHDDSLRCSADGFGTRVRVLAGAGYAEQEWTTLSAGLGQSRQPLLLGMGANPRADAILLHWPDGMRQVERGLLAGHRNVIEYHQRKHFW
jgi:tetratricopeptide (TPR) repeat protein